MLLRFKIRELHMRLVSKMEAEFHTFCPLPRKNFGRGGRNVFVPHLRSNHWYVLLTDERRLSVWEIKSQREVRTVKQKTSGDQWTLRCCVLCYTDELALLLHWQSTTSYRLVSCSQHVSRTQVCINPNGHGTADKPKSPCTRPLQLDFHGSPCVARPMHGRPLYFARVLFSNGLFEGLQTEFNLTVPHVWTWARFENWSPKFGRAP